MARAKRTDRAEARRRHRALAAQADLEAPADEAAAEDDATRETVAPRARLSSEPDLPPPGTRVGLGTALRLSIRPADVRGDLAALPWLIRHTKAIWVPSALVAASTALLLAPGGAQNQWFVVIAQAFVVPPPMGTSFLAGLMAPRGAWLAGGVVGLVAAAAFSLFALTYSALPSTGAPGTTTIATEAERSGLILYAFAASPLFGIGIGAFAGFYRRFLAYSSPNRGRRPQGRPGGRPQRGQRRTGRPFAGRQGVRR